MDRAHPQPRVGQEEGSCATAREDPGFSGAGGQAPVRGRVDHWPPPSSPPMRKFLSNCNFNYTLTNLTSPALTFMVILPEEDSEEEVGDEKRERRLQPPPPSRRVVDSPPSPPPT